MIQIHKNNTFYIPCSIPKISSSGYVLELKDGHTYNLVDSTPSDPLFYKFTNNFNLGFGEYEYILKDSQFEVASKGIIRFNLTPGIDSIQVEPVETGYVEYESVEEGYTNIYTIDEL